MSTISLSSASAASVTDLAAESGGAGDMTTGRAVPNSPPLASIKPLPVNSLANDDDDGDRTTAQLAAPAAMPDSPSSTAAHFNADFLSCFAPLGRFWPHNLFNWSSQKHIPSDSDTENYEIPIDSIDVQWEENFIGGGNQSSVFRGKFRGQWIALKKLNRTSEVDIKRLCSLEHANVIKTLGICTKEHFPCIVMEYCEKGSLFEHLRRNPKISKSLFINCSTQIAEGMCYLHSLKIVHRDLKSPNILIDKNNTVKICDFGSLYSWDQRLNSQAQNLQGMASVVMSVCGTSQWMSPEMLTNKPCNERVDVWSYGVVLWELLTGEVPYDKMPPTTVWFLVGSGNLQLHVPKTAPSSVSFLLTLCWAKNPRNRPSFKTILKDLLSNVRAELADLQEEGWGYRREQWRRDIGDRMAKLHNSGMDFVGERQREQELVTKRMHELRHAQEIRQMYEEKLQRVNKMHTKMCRFTELMNERKRDNERVADAMRERLAYDAHWHATLHEWHAELSEWHAELGHNNNGAGRGTNAVKKMQNGMDGEELRHILLRAEAAKTAAMLTHGQEESAEQQQQRQQQHLLLDPSRASSTFGIGVGQQRQKAISMEGGGQAVAEQPTAASSSPPLPATAVVQSAPLQRMPMLDDDDDGASNGQPPRRHHAQNMAIQAQQQRRQQQQQQHGHGHGQQMQRRNTLVVTNNNNSAASIGKGSTAVFCSSSSSSSSREDCSSAEEEEDHHHNHRHHHHHRQAVPATQPFKKSVGSSNKCRHCCETNKRMLWLMMMVKKQMQLPPATTTMALPKTAQLAEQKQQQHRHGQQCHCQRKQQCGDRMPPHCSSDTMMVLHNSSTNSSFCHHQLADFGTPPPKAISRDDSALSCTMPFSPSDQSLQNVSYCPDSAAAAAAPTVVASCLNCRQFGTIQPQQISQFFARNSLARASGLSADSGVCQEDESADGNANVAHWLNVFGNGTTTCCLAPNTCQCTTIAATTAVDGTATETTATISRKSSSSPTTTTTTPAATMTSAGSNCANNNNNWASPSASKHRRLKEARLRRRRPPASASSATVSVPATVAGGVPTPTTTPAAFLQQSSTFMRNYSLRRPSSAARRARQCRRRLEPQGALDFDLLDRLCNGVGNSSSGICCSSSANNLMPLFANCDQIETSAADWHQTTAFAADQKWHRPSGTLDQSGDQQQQLQQHEMGRAQQLFVPMPSILIGDHHDHHHDHQHWFSLPELYKQHRHELNCEMDQTQCDRQGTMSPSIGANIVNNSNSCAGSEEEEEEEREGHNMDDEDSEQEQNAQQHNTADESAKKLMTATTLLDTLLASSTMVTSLERSLELSAAHSDGLSDKEAKLKEVKTTLKLAHRRTSSNPSYFPRKMPAHAHCVQQPTMKQQAQQQQKVVEKRRERSDSATDNQ